MKVKWGVENLVDTTGGCLKQRLETTGKIQGKVDETGELPLARQPRSKRGKICQVIETKETCWDGVMHKPCPSRE